MFRRHGRGHLKLLFAAPAESRGEPAVALWRSLERSTYRNLRCVSRRYKVLNKHLRVRVINRTTRVCLWQCQLAAQFGLFAAGFPSRSGHERPYGMERSWSTENVFECELTVCLLC